MKRDIPSLISFSSSFKLYSIKIIKIFLSLLIFYLLYSSIDVDAMSLALLSAQPLLLIFAFILSVCGVFLSVFRWKMSLAVQGIIAPVMKILSLTLESSFVGLIVPTSFGSDSVKGYGMYKYSHSGTGVLASILFERVCGFFSLLIIGAFSIVFASSRMSDTFLLRYIAVLYVILLVLVIPFLSPSILFRIKMLIDRLAFLNFFQKYVHNLVHAIQLYSSNKPIYLFMLGISLVFQFVGIYYYYLIARSIGFQIPFSTFCFAVPLVTLITALPIAPGAIGVKEGAFVVLLNEFGVAPSIGLLISLLATALYLVLVGVGGILYLASSRSGKHALQA